MGVVSSLTLAPSHRRSNMLPITPLARFKTHYRWGPGRRAGELNRKHGYPNAQVPLQYADYLNRPGVGLYGMKENIKYANETDIAVQLVEADLLQRHRFLTAWNSKYKDLLGELW